MYFQTLIIGDSRVKYLMKNWQGSEDGTLWWKIKGGAKMEDVMRMIEETAEERKEVDLVIIVGILCDVYQLYPSWMEKWPAPKKMMDLNSKVDGPDYPSKMGVGKEIKRIEMEVKNRWREAGVVWVIPYPIDCRRYVKSRAGEEGEEMPREVAEWLDKITYQGVQHLRALEPCIRRNVAPYMSVSWFPYWKSVGDRNGSYKAFMDKARMRGGSGIELCPEATNDGVHPTPEVCVSLIRTLREVMKRERRRRKDMEKRERKESKEIRNEKERKEKIEEMRRRVEEILILREMAEDDEKKERGVKELEIPYPEEKKEEIEDKYEEGIEEEYEGEMEDEYDEGMEDECEEGVEHECLWTVQLIHYPCDHWEMGDPLADRAVCPVCGREWRLKSEEEGETARLKVHNLMMRVLEVVTEDEEE